MNEPAEIQRQPQAKNVDVMKAAVLTAPRTIEIDEVAVPVPGADEVLIKLEGTGLCSSNIPVWEGRDWFSYPVAAGNPGHEGWGTVEQVGANVTALQIGDRVSCLSYNAYAEYDIAKAEQVVKLPKSFAGKPFPGEPLGCAMNIFARSDIHQGQNVAIVGAGFLGLLLVQLCKSAGANVIAISQRDFSLEAANTVGADHLIKMDDHYEIINKVTELTGGQLCERVIEVTGKEWPLNLSIELTAERGKLIVAGFHQDGMRSVNMQMLNWRGIDLISAHERDPKQYIKGIQDAIVAVEDQKMDPFPLYTHQLPLGSAAEAFEILASRPDGFIKALIIN